MYKSMIDAGGKGCTACTPHDSWEMTAIYNCGHTATTTMWHSYVNKEAREQSRAAANCSQCILLASTLSRGQDRGLTSLSKQETVEFLDRCIPGWEDWDVEVLDQVSTRPRCGAGSTNSGTSRRTCA